MNQKIVTYFMSSEDANKYLNEIVQQAPQAVNDYRVMTTSLESVMNKIHSKKQSRKAGRMPIVNLFRIQVPLI
jgi:NAD-specific glutamate dehydrogenase